MTKLAGQECLTTPQLWSIITSSILIQWRSSLHGFEAWSTYFLFGLVEFWFGSSILNGPAPKMMPQAAKTFLFLVNLNFYFRQLYTFLDFWWISCHFLIKSLPMNIFDMMNMNLTSKSQELTFFLAQLTFPNLINFQSTDQLKIFWIKSKANIPSLDTWNHVKNLENKFGPKSCQFTAFIENPNLALFVRR